MVLNQDTLYYERMASSIGDKARILPFITGEKILEIGFGGGELLDLIAEKGYDVYGLDASAVSEAKALNKSYGCHTVEAYADEILSHWKPETFDTVILSSVLHEVFSYGNRNGNGKHSISAVIDTLHAVYDCLADNGRIIIRDGVKASNWDEPVLLTMLNNDNQGVQDYLDLQPFEQVSLTKTADSIWAGNLESVEAFAYTYTWGKEALPRESQELFGVLTLAGYSTLLKNHGFSMVYAQEYVQQGYVDALSPNLRITTLDGRLVPFPSTNALWVAEKT